MRRFPPEGVTIVIGATVICGEEVEPHCCGERDPDIRRRGLISHMLTLPWPSLIVNGQVESTPVEGGDSSRASRYSSPGTHGGVG
jgi:hypothetical protein